MSDKAPVLSLEVGSIPLGLTNADQNIPDWPEHSPFFYKITNTDDGMSWGYLEGFDRYDEAHTAGKKKVDEILERFE